MISIPFATSLLRSHWKLIATASIILALSLYAWRLDSLRASYKRERDEARAEFVTFKRDVVAQSEAALAQQKAINVAQEKTWKDKADEADKSVDDLRDRLRAALLRAQAGGSAGGRASAPAQDDGAGVPQEMPATAGNAEGPVCVNPETLAGLAAYGIAAHRWALSIDPN